MALLVRLATLAAEHSELVMTGRSHNVAAQATTLGKRFASAADEILVAFQRLEELIARYPLRGIKGPVGTSQDMLDLLGGDPDKLAELERRVAGHLGFRQGFTSVGQVYPRSLDYDVLSALVQLAAGPTQPGQDHPADGRHRAGHRGLQGGPGRLLRHAAQDEHPLLRAGQRPRGDPARLRLDGRPSSAATSGTRATSPARWCRRVALPDAFFAFDGLLETFLTVLDEFGAFPAVIAAELDRYLPFLGTTKVLMAAVRAGVGRETAHEAIKEHAVASALAMRAGARENQLLDRLAADERIPLDRPAWTRCWPTSCPSPERRPPRSPRSSAGSARSPPRTPRPRSTRRAPSSDLRHGRPRWLECMNRVTAPPGLPESGGPWPDDRRTRLRAPRGGRVLRLPGPRSPT